MCGFLVFEFVKAYIFLQLTFFYSHPKYVIKDQSLQALIASLCQQPADHSPDCLAMTSNFRILKQLMDRL